MAIGIFTDLDHVSDRLAPWKLVGVVFEWSNEHDRAFLGGDRVCEVILLLQRVGYRQSQDADHSVDGSGTPTADEDHCVFI